MGRVSDLTKGFLVEAPTWAPNGRVLKYFKQNPTAEDGTGGETYIYRVDITGFNEQRIVRIFRERSCLVTIITVIPSCG